MDSKTATPATAATAVISLGAAPIAAARELVTRFARVSEAFGPALAEWTCADNRTEGPADLAIKAWQSSGAATGVINSIPGHGKSTAVAAWGADCGAFMLSACEVDSWPWGGGDRALQLLRAPIVVLDDLGRENSSGQGREVMINKLAARHDAGRKTLVSTMLTRDGGALAYAEHWLDRVGSQWLAIRSRESMRDGREPILTRLAAAREIHRLASRVGFMGAGTSEPEPAPIRELAAKLGLSWGAVELEAARLAEQRRACAAIGDAFLDRLEAQAAAGGVP